MDLAWYWWAAAGALAVGAGAGLRWWRANGLRREVERTLQRAARGVLRGVVVPDGVEGHLYVDCLLLTHRGLVVVDLRDVRGAVFGAEQMDEWTVLDGVRRFTFSNPLVALHDRVLAVRHLCGEPVEVEGRVVFTPRASFPKGLPPRVVPLHDLQAVLASGDAQQEVPPAVQAAWDQLTRAAVEPRR
jgi:hypothetical protein